MVKQKLIPNVNPETGVHYGVINANSLDSDILDTMYTHGTDLSYEQAKKDIVADIVKTMSNYTSDRHLERLMDTIEELTDNVLEECESHGPYEFEYEGVKGLYSTESNTVMIFESPVVVSALACSPCYPNAADLDNVVDYGSNGYNVITYAYGVPLDWLYKEE